MPDNPIQIADAALYLSETKPSLGIKDPYELTSDQLKAAVDLLKAQRPLVKKYWVLASDEIAAFTNGGVTIGAAWPLVPATLIAHGVEGQVDDPEGRRDGLGRHLDGQLEGAAPELRDALAEVHRAGQGGRRWRRSSTPTHRPTRRPVRSSARLCTPLHADADAKLLLADQVLEDPDLGTAATARPTACPTTPGSRPGPRSRARRDAPLSAELDPGARGGGRVASTALLPPATGVRRLKLALLLLGAARLARRASTWRRSGPCWSGVLAVRRLHVVGQPRSGRSPTSGRSSRHLIRRCGTSRSAPSRVAALVTFLDARDRVPPRLLHDPHRGAGHRAACSCSGS